MCAVPSGFGSGGSGASVHPPWSKTRSFACDSQRNARSIVPSLSRRCMTATGVSFIGCRYEVVLFDYLPTLLVAPPPWWYEEGADAPRLPKRRRFRGIGLG